jgi:hypothetical protein
MELRELWNLFCKEKNLYVFILGTFLLLGVLWINLEPKRFESNTLITIGRTESKGISPTSDYQYDNFYRLQADERFGDTLVRLLATPQVTQDIFREAGVENGASQGGYFKGRKLSAQIVEVTFIDTDQTRLEVLAKTIPMVLDHYTSELDTKEGSQGNWFRVVASQPVISDARIDSKQVLGIALFLGIFMGFWIILAKHYIQTDSTKKD